MSDADHPADSDDCDDLQPATAGSSAPPMRVAERWALQTARGLAGERILCSSLGRGQAAAALASERPAATVVCWYLDQYQQRLAIAAQQGASENLSIVCSADFPDQPFDLAVLPLSFRGEGELARDLLQAAFARLQIGGQLVTAVDNPRDRWLHEQLREMFPKVSVIAGDDAVCYVVAKRAVQRRSRSLSSQFSFRDGPRRIHVVTRPGVFSHRRLDPGAHQLIDAAGAWPALAPPTTQRSDTSVGDAVSGDAAGAGAVAPRIIDIGCGCGAVGIALAARQSDPGKVHVLSLDSNARAIACAAASARLNGIDSLVPILESGGRCDQPGSYDIAVANPPYYADFRIARLFVDSAATALRPGGMLYLVTKHPAWYQENLFPLWRDAVIAARGKYFIVTARRG